MKKKAFTLIELLVVISIIALLLSILMPALTKVKDQARLVVCRSNIRQISIAMETYKVSCDNKALSSSLNGDSRIWANVIAPYMGDDKYYDDPQATIDGVMKIIKCPTANRVDPAVPAPTPILGSKDYSWRYQGVDTETGIPLAAEGSIGLNTWVAGIDLDVQVAAGWISQEQVNASSMRDDTAKSDTPFLADSSWFEGLPMDPALANTSTAGYSVSMYPDMYPHYRGDYTNDDRGMTRFAIDRHDLAINIVFVDGHAEKVDIEDLWKLKWAKTFKTTNDDFKLTPTTD